MASSLINMCLCSAGRRTQFVLYLQFVICSQLGLSALLPAGTQHIPVPAVVSNIYCLSYAPIWPTLLATLQKPWMHFQLSFIFPVDLEGTKELSDHHLILFLCQLLYVGHESLLHAERKAAERL